MLLAALFFLLFWFWYRKRRSPSSCKLQYFDNTLHAEQYYRCRRRRCQSLRFLAGRPCRGEFGEVVKCYGYPRGKHGHTCRASFNVSN